MKIEYLQGRQDSMKRETGETCAPSIDDEKRNLASTDCPGGVEWTARFPLSTKGRYVIDQTGRRFRLCGINWYGASDSKHVVGGLDVQKVDVICSSVHTLGFTVVRLPFSNEMLRSDVPVGSINYNLNPELRGLSPIQVLDEVITSLGRHQVAVILNNHTTYGEWCGPPSKNSLWFDSGTSYTEENWLDDWEMMAKRYVNSPHVVGYDLRNEIRPRLGQTPHWGDKRWCCKRRKETCWARVSQTVARRLLAVSPKALIIVERLVWPQNGVREYVESPGPLLPEFNGRLVIGVHHYSWSGPGRFLPKWAVPRGCKWVDCLLRMCRIISPKNYGDMTLSCLETRLRKEWGCVLEDNICPIWVSEFGTDLGEVELKWLEKFVAVLKKLDADWAYWPLNVGPKPSCAEDEAYGLLAKDWTATRRNDPRIEMLSTIGLTRSVEDVGSPWHESDSDNQELPLLPAVLGLPLHDSDCKRRVSPKPALLERTPVIVSQGLPVHESDSKRRVSPKCSNTLHESDYLVPGSVDSSLLQ